MVSISLRGPRDIIVQYDKLKTNPNIIMLGGDDNYLRLSGYKILSGRNFNKIDVSSGRSVCVLGDGVARKLFGDNPQRALDKVIKVNNMKYLVTGVLVKKGSSAFLNADNVIITTYNNIRRVFNSSNTSFNIGVMVDNVKSMEGAIGEAKGTFRPVRKLDIREDDNFFIEKVTALLKCL